LDAEILVQQEDLVLHFMYRQLAVTPQLSSSGPCHLHCPLSILTYIMHNIFLELGTRPNPISAETGGHCHLRFNK
jgi:hypothetical protein